MRNFSVNAIVARVRKRNEQKKEGRERQREKEEGGRTSVKSNRELKLEVE